MTAVERLHGAVVLDRRARLLAEHIAPLLPIGARVLDIGAGDGTIAALLLEHRSDIAISGVDVLVRPETQVPVAEFDGIRLPYDDDSFDVTLLVDVLHHAQEPETLLQEAGRVATSRVVVKDHTANGILAFHTLRFMDRIGNRRHGVALPYAYWTRREWDDAFARLGLVVEVEQAKLSLYPWPASMIFDRSLQFIAALKPD